MYYDRTGISEGNDLAESNNSKGCLICHYWFYNLGFKFQDSVCNGCHNLTMLSVDPSDNAIVRFKNVYYLCIIHNISKSEAINSLKNCSWKLLIYINK